MNRIAIATPISPTGAAHPTIHRRPFTPFEIAVAATAIGWAALTLLYHFALPGHVGTPWFFSVIVLLAGAPLLARWRWAPLLPAVPAGLMLTFALLSGRIGQLTGGTPDPVRAAYGMTLTPLIVVLLGSGVAAAVTNYRGAAASGGAAAPAARRALWLYVALGVLAGWGAGAIVSAVRAQATTPAAVSAEILAQLPAFRMANMRFEPSELRARVGETVALRLENTESALPHSLDVNELGIHVSVPGGQSALAIFRPASAGVFTYYCAIPGHREAGMTGTLVVTQ